MHLHTLTVLVRNEHAHPLAAAILDGRIEDAIAAAQDIIAGAGPRTEDAALCEIAQLHGDLMLAFDRNEEAGQSYRLAVKLAASGPREQERRRLLACRGAGFVSLHRYGFDAAAERFTLLANAKVSTPAQKVEALCALAVAHNGLGQAGLARSVLDRADAHAAAMETPEAATLVALVRADLIAQQRLRVHESLNDHVFWRSSEPEDAPADSPGSALTLIDDCLATQGRHALIGQRLRQLRDLLLAADGDARALAALPDHVDWLRRVGLAACAHQAQIETVLAAAAAGDVDLAQATMEPLRAGSTDHPHWRIELSYCEAKVSALAGQPVESMQHYRRYVLESMQCIRAVANATPSDSASPRSASADAPQDDVERRLPARYQPAYRYMLEHLGRRDLSIREIAEHMGISTRTLQITFERHLGMTPTEVIDRCRIERIRADLLRDAGRRTISETGARWGIPHRSTLNACYRKFFHETPSKTLARSHSGPIRS